MWPVDCGFRTIITTPKGMSLMYQQFLSIQKASDGDILKLARKWGVLGICEHGLPPGHLLQTTLPETAINDRCKLPQSNGLFSETFQSWRNFSRLLNAINWLAIDLRHDKAGQRERWETINEWWTVSSGMIAPSEKYSHLSSVINRLMELIDVRPQLLRRKDGWVMSLTVSPDLEGRLLPVLVLRTIQQLDSQLASAVCSACNKSYDLRYGQSFKRNHYCDECGTKAAWRDASRKYRKRQRENPLREKKIRQGKKLTEQDVREIRIEWRKLKNEKRHMSELDFGRMYAGKYAVSVSNIEKIIRGVIWKGVE